MCLVRLHPDPHFILPVLVFQDPLTTVREQCEQLEKCVKARERLELCDERVSSRSQTEEDCTEELFDFLHARDHCVSQREVGKGRACSSQEHILFTNFCARGSPVSDTVGHCVSGTVYDSPGSVLSLHVGDRCHFPYFTDKSSVRTK